MLLKFNVRPMDLVAIDTGSGKRLYSFLSVGWALISDVDIESEKYRSLGGARFTVGAFVRILGELKCCTVKIFLLIMLLFTFW